jgi:hypothetical protein
MSTLLGYDSFLIDIGASIADVKNEIKTRVSARGWQILVDDTVNNILYIQPPVTETIGNSIGKEVLRIKVTGNSISFANQLISNTYFPQEEIFYLAASMTGIKTFSLILNGQTLSYTTSSAGNTALQNATEFTNFLNASANAEAQKFTFTVGANGNCLVNLKAKVASTPTATVTSGNANGTIIHVADRVASGDMTPYGLFAGGVASDTTPLISSFVGTSVTTDLVSGFIYYLAIHTRSIVLATKTTTNFYGPIVASWASNSEAVSQLPNSALAPIELAVADISAATASGTRAYLSHYWSYTSYTLDSKPGYTAITAMNDGYDPQPCTCVWNGRWRGYGFDPVFIQDNVAWAYNADLNGYALASPVLRALGVEGDLAATYGHVFGYPDISSLVLVAGTTTKHPGAYTYGHTILPRLVFDDVYIWTTTAASTSESTHYSKSITSYCSLTDVLDSTTAYTTINVSDTSSFPASGGFIIDSELFEYTGKTGTSFTGVTRGKYGSTQTTHVSGTSTYLTLWFVKINAGLLHCGYVRPN